MTQSLRRRMASVSALAILALLGAGTLASAQTRSEKPAANQKDKAKPAAKPSAGKPDKAAKPADKKATAKKDAAKKDTKPAATGKPAASAKPASPAKPAAKTTAKPAPKPAAPNTAAAPRPAAPVAAAPAIAVPAAAMAAPAFQAESPPAPARTGSFFGNIFTPQAAQPAALAPSDPDPEPASAPLAYAPSGPLAGGDVDAVKEAIAAARAGRTDAASERRDQVRDSAGQKLIEWMILRSDDTNASFARYAAFVKANPSWPSVRMIKRRAESQLWREKREPGAVFAFFSNDEPAGSTGRLAYARALLAQGDRNAALKYVREAWREDALGPDTEAQALEAFGSLLTRADHKARMDIRLYAEDHDAALRAAKRLGAAELAVAQARIAVNRKAGNAGALIAAAQGAAGNDAGLLFSRIQFLRRADKIDQATQLLLSAPREPSVIHDTDEWWVERRLIARKLLDEGNAQAAYKVAANAGRPEKVSYKVEQAFTAGWIALRFVKDPGSAQRHFAEILKLDVHPTSQARGHYWLARTAEAQGRSGEAQQHYQAAARHSAAYYGQLARARLGQRDMAVRRPSRNSARVVDLARALEFIYATGNRDLAITFVADLDRLSDSDAFAALGDVAAKHNDPRATMMIGKAAIARGLPFDHYAFPAIGIPKYASIGTDVDRSLVFAIARQESAFNARAVSSARAMGLMQVTPGTGRIIAKKHGVAFSEAKLLNDPTFNSQLGAAELGTLLADYGGSHVLTFVGYNAGRGRVKEWVQRYGDPRDPSVDIVDWVERIPFTETRNYVQRVMENMQVYKARFGSARLAIDSDMRGSRGGSAQVIP